MKELIEKLDQKTSTIAVVGLGYVGLPLAHALSRAFAVVGYDIDHERIASLKAGHDATGEIAAEDLRAAELSFTSDPQCLASSHFIIVTVPTPITAAKVPDLEPLRKSSETIGRYLQAGTVVVYESTVYPGVTEEFCGPLLEKASGLRSGQDFFLGYSPERINPGDKVHTVENIIKVVSGQNDDVLQVVAHVYERVVKAGIHRAANIRTAEAAKVIENTQRDLNIAFVNELAIVFHHLGLNTNEVLAAAGTKWNFLQFQPGLVGGHCIGVDPYYLIHKAQESGYDPLVIQAGRRINDGMGRFVASQTIKEMIKAGHPVVGSKVLVLGLTFKENIPDTRNSRVVDILNEFADYGLEVYTHDPFAAFEDTRHLPGTRLERLPTKAEFGAVVIAVPHQPYRELGVAGLAGLADEHAVFVDVKSMFKAQEVEPFGCRYWSL